MEIKEHQQATQARFSEKEIFVSFYLNESEFALSVTHVQEVVNPPEKYTSLPLAPPYLVGLFNLRGTIIPVVELRSLLKMTGAPQGTDRQKIAIVELQGHCIGILFDRTGEVFRGDSQERSDFSYSGNESVIRGVFKKDDGGKLVQILDVSALFDLKYLPKQGDGSGARGRKSLQSRKGLRKQCISFVVGPAKCSLGIDEIQEILKVEKVNESALAVHHCIGSIDLRGTTVPVIDFPALLGYRERDSSPTATHGDRRVIVMRLENELFGLLVDAVDSIVTYYQEDLKEFAVLNPERSEMFAGCITLAGRDEIILLEHRKILSNSEIQEITHGHNRIYNVTLKSQNEKKSKGVRRTYITFSVEGAYAILMNEVKEIISYPSQLLQPPGLPPHCMGVLNHRGELVTIVDAREMYGRQKRSDTSSGKVLIFKKEALHFGLVVDSVEAIVSISDSDKIKLPEALYRHAGGLSNDVVEAIQYKDSQHQDKSMLILTSDSIAARVAKTA